MSGDPRLPELFIEASELEPEGREALLERLHRDEPQLAAALRSLLAHPETEASPIDRPPLLGNEGGGPATSAPPPERVGPYRLLRQIGRGGMGRVFLAEQETPDFRRKVALKLIDHHAADEEGVRRFRDEVRILAALEHPGIARFLDGGRSAEGVWFLALEYIEGADLVSHATRHGLDARARLELVQAVAEAVAYAHREGVIHRDLKPDNILVDREGRPRLLDFGISKLFDPGSAGPTTTMRDGPRPLTPAYASPEQLAGGTATTASDVYSLGVTLYELLCGVRPTTSGSADGPGAGGAPPPSELLRRTGAEAVPRRWWRELDAVCLKALRAASVERYPDAGAFARALRDVLAPPTARRFLLPRRALWAGAALLIVGLLVPLLRTRFAGSSGTPPAPASPAARAGERTARTFPFDPVSPPPIAELERKFADSPGDVVSGSALACALAREKRFDEAAIVIGRLRQIPGSELDPLTDFAEGRIASLRKERQRALVFLTRARDNAIASGRNELLGEIRGLRGSVLAALGEREAAIAELELAVADAERAGDALRAYRSLNDFAIERLQRGELAQGEELLERALRAAGPADVRPLLVLSNLAEVQTVRGRPDLAEKNLLHLLELRRQVPSPLREGQIQMKRYEALRDLGRLPEATAALDDAIRLLSFPEGDLDRAVALFLRADSDLDAARFDRIDDLVTAMEDIARQRLDRRALGLAHQIRGRHLGLAGVMPGARREFSEAHRILVDQGDVDLAARSDLALATAEASAGEEEEALAVLRAGLDPQTVPAAGTLRCFSAALEARIAAGRGEVAPAEALLAPFAAEASDTPSLARRLAWSAATGALAAARGRSDEARRELSQALAAAEGSGRRAAAIELRIDLAALASGPAAATDVSGIAAEAERLGLAGLGRRARDLARRLSSSGAL